MIEPKNCPCCNTGVEVIRGEWLDEVIGTIKCTGCGLSIMRLGKTLAFAKMEAVKAWNQRWKEEKEHGNLRARGKPS
jgi:transcription elongation factor Elf1